MSNPDILTITPPGKGEVIKITPEGRLFWHGREVETDANFRAAMMELADYFKGSMPGLAPRFTRTGDAVPIELLQEIQEYLEDCSDVSDSADGTQRPNRAMALGTQLECYLPQEERS